MSLRIAVLAIVAGSAFAQVPEAPKSGGVQKFYKLEFVVKEVEAGKVLNARSYSMTVPADVREHASIRAGNKVPVAMGGPDKAFRNIQYIDVGVNIDCSSVREVERDLALTVTAEISSVPAEAGAAKSDEPGAPMVRQNKWSSSVIVPLRKPTLIFSSDDLGSKRQMQLELTATPIT